MNPVIREMEVGVGFTSVPFSTAGLVPRPATPNRIDIFTGRGYGFIILAFNSSYNSQLSTGSPKTDVLRVRVIGIGKQSNDYIWVQPNVWYDCPFDGLQVESQLPFTNILDAGDWFCNIAIKPYASVAPATPLLTSDVFPAASGGPGSWQRTTEIQLLTAPVPPAPPATGLGQLITNAMQSVFRVSVESIGEVTQPNIVGGGIDLWRYEQFSTVDGYRWYLVGSNIPLPTGSPRVSMPMDVFGIFGVRRPGDKWWALTNNVILDDGGVATTVKVQMVSA